MAFATAMNSNTSIRRSINSILFTKEGGLERLLANFLCEMPADNRASFKTLIAAL